MAPRRGGGGSGGGSIDNQCSDYDAFSDGYSVAAISISAVLLFLFLVLAYLVDRKSGARKKANQPKGILRWYHFGLGLFFSLAYFIMLIISYVLSECRVLTTQFDYNVLGTVTELVYFLGEYFLLAVILFVVINKMLLLAGSSGIRRTLKILNIVMYVFAIIMGAVSLAMILVDEWGVRVTRESAYVLAYVRLWQIAAVLYVVIAITAVIELSLAWIKISRRPEAKVGVVGWIPVLSISILGYSLYECVRAFYVANEPGVAYFVGWTIGELLFYFAWFAIFMISRGQGWEWLNTGANNPSVAAYDMRSQPVAYGSPYDPQVPAEAKRQSSVSYPQSPTPAPPYAGAYSGHGVYDQQGSTYTSGSWGTGGYAPVHQTSYSAPVGAASRGTEENELLGRR